MSEISSGTRAGYVEFFAGLAQRQEIDRSNAKNYLHAGSRVMSVEPDPAGDVRDLNVDDVLARFEAQNPDLSPDSVKTYRSRFRVGVAMYRAFLDGDADWKNAGKSVGAREATVGQGTGRPQQGGETPGRIVAYDLPLRPDLLVRINLPVDLTTADADRLAAFVRSLAFDPPAGDTSGAVPGPQA